MRLAVRVHRADAALKPKPGMVPKDKAGYLIITCPKCLRSNRLEATSLNGGLHETPCQSCGTPVRFEINHEIEPLIKRNPLPDRPQFAG
ncbi:MAG: hypothetical protein LAO22_18440 [Acidobacteriia bacterium]|nr:hypothetical protein [Terriglobia bacterium]